MNPEAKSSPMGGPMLYEGQRMFYFRVWLISELPENPKLEICGIYFVTKHHCMEIFRSCF